MENPFCGPHYMPVYIIHTALGVSFFAMLAVVSDIMMSNR